MVVFTLFLFPWPVLAETEPNNSIAQANAISIGYNHAEINATISATNDVDYFKFTVVANRTYVIETFNIQGTPGSAATGLRLYNSAGTEIADDEYGHNGTGNANVLEHIFLILMVTIITPMLAIWTLPIR